jgi:hypothetical protein
MSKTKLTIFDPIREYLIAAIQKCPNQGIDNCPGAETLKCFYEYDNYLDYDSSKNYQTIPAEFTKRVLFFALELNKLDRSATRGTLEASLVTKADNYAVEFTSMNDFIGGASKIINLESTEQVGGAPFKSTKLVGSYSDEYLKGLTSEIKKTYNLFGGFKKTSKEIIGTIEELNILLHNDIKQQLSNSLNQRYYKNYLTGGAVLEVAKLLKELSTGNVDQNDLDIFNAFMMVMELKKTDKVTDGKGTVVKLASIEDPASLWTPVLSISNSFRARKDVWYRINLKREGPSSISKDGLKTDKAFMIEKYIPKGIGGVVNPKGVTETDSEWLRNTFICYLHMSQNGTLLSKDVEGTTKCVEFTSAELKWNHSLQHYLDCDKIVRDSLKSSKVNEAIEKDYPYKITYPNLDGWLRMDDGSYVKTLPNGDTVVYKEGDDKYNELFKTKNKCFNSFAYPGSNENCCLWMKAVLAGHTQALPDFLKDPKNKFNWSSAPDDIKQAHPILVYKVLQAFGFNKDLIYDQATRGQKIWKMQSVAKWQTKFVDQKIKKELVDIVKNNSELNVYLQVLVDYVNSNPSILNDGYVGSTNSTVIDVPEVFKKRGVLPCVNPTKKHKYSTNWNELTKQINAVNGDFYNGLNFKSPSQLPFGMNNLFPLTQTYGFGNVYRGSTLHGGAASDGKSEVILDLKQSHPQFTTQVSVEIRKVLDKLKSLNKPLSDSEFNRIKSKLKQFSDLEIELYNHIGAIDTYSKLVSIFNKEGSRETVNMNFIRNYINRYQPLVEKFENTKTGLEGLLSVIKEYADEDENDVDFSALATRGL